MNRATKILLIGTALIAFALMNAEISESVSTFQLNRAYECSETKTTCTGYFGNLRIKHD